MIGARWFVACVAGPLLVAILACLLCSLAGCNAINLPAEDAAIGACVLLCASIAFVAWVRGRQ